MKTKRRLLALVLVVLMTMALAIPAFADTTGKITITNAVSGKTYKAYKIFDLAEGYDKGDYVYTWTGDTSDLPTGYATYFTFTEKTTGVYTVTATDDAKDTDGQLTSGAIAILAAMKGTTETGKVTASSATAEITGLAPGYYYVTSTQGSAVVVTTTKPNATISDKNVSPTWDNEPENPEGGEDPNPGKVIIDTEPHCGKELGTAHTAHTDDCYKTTVNSVNIGDTVTFNISINATNYDLDKLITYYYVTDTLPAGMTYNNDMVVKVDTTSYTPTANTNVESFTDPDGGTFSLRFKWAKLNTAGDALESIYSGMFHTINITYTATVNDTAVIGAAGNVNKANFTYDTYEPVPGVDPEDPTPDPDPDPDPDNEKETTTYIYSLGVFKHDSSDNALSGATFSLHKGSSTAAAIAFYTNTTDAAAGVYTYNIVDTTKLSADSGADGKYVGGKTTFTTGSTGTLEFKGLEAGTYYLVEETAPTGFNKLTSPIEIIIAEVTADATTSNTYTESIAYEADVLNNKGTELPATGGIGTTLFVSFGMIAMLGTGVFLVTNKRISKETF